jgi:hypothetical protein
MPVEVHVTLGVAQLATQSERTIPFPAGKANIQGLGICTGDRNSPDYDGSNYGLSCDSALRGPSLTHLTVQWSDYPCNRAQTPASQLVTGVIDVGTLAADAAEFGLSPVVHQQINPSNGTVSLPDNGSRQRYLCSGTPMTLTSYTAAYRTIVEFTTPRIMVADYLPTQQVIDTTQY